MKNTNNATLNATWGATWGALDNEVESL